jgi:hypothetical protein
MESSEVLSSITESIDMNIHQHLNRLTQTNRT